MKRGDAKIWVEDNQGYKQIHDTIQQACACIIELVKDGQDADDITAYEVRELTFACNVQVEFA